MRKLSFLLACILALSCIVPMTVSADATTGKTYTARYTTTAPALTGHGYETEAVWQNLGTWDTLHRVRVESALIDPEVVADVTPQVKILNDNNNIYISIWCEDVTGCVAAGNKGADATISTDCFYLGLVTPGETTPHYVIYAPAPIGSEDGASASACYTQRWELGTWKGNLTTMDASQIHSMSYRYRENGKEYISADICIPKNQIVINEDGTVNLELAVCDDIPEKKDGVAFWTWSSDLYGVHAVRGGNAATYATVTLEGPQATYVGKGPDMLGDLSDPAWVNSKGWEELKNIANSAKVPADIVNAMDPQFKILHDDDYIYIGVKYNDLTGCAANGRSATDVLSVGFRTESGEHRLYNIQGALPTSAEQTKTTGIHTVYYKNNTGSWKGDIYTPGETNTGLKDDTLAYGVSSRDGETGILSFELRIPKTGIKIEEDGTFKLNIEVSDCGNGTNYDKWGAVHFCWSGTNVGQYKNGATENYANFATVKLGGACDHLGEKIAVPEVAATCTTPGNAAGEKCADCGKYFMEVIPALGHQTVTLRENETLIEDGNKLSYTSVSRCKTCGETVTSAEKTTVAYEAAYATTAPSIDGRIDAAWANALEVTMNGTSTQNPSFKVMHDDTYIYALMYVDDANSTIRQHSDTGAGIIDGVSSPMVKGDVGAETMMIAFRDNNGYQKEYMFTSPVPEDGNPVTEDGYVSMNVYCYTSQVWAGSPQHVADDAEGMRGYATRIDGQLVYELRIPKKDLGDMSGIVGMELYLSDAAAAAQQWLAGAYAWSYASPSSTDKLGWIKDDVNFGALVFEGAPAHEHTEVEIPAVEATCTVEGFTAGVKCSECDEILTAPVSLGKLEHKAAEDAEWITDAENHWHVCATCDEIVDLGEHDGAVCDTCGYAVNDVVYTIGSAEGAVGETVKVPFSITTYVPSANYIADLVYDKDKLEFVGFADFTELGLSDSEEGGLCDPDYGSFMFMWDDDDLYTGILCYAEFKILAESEEPIEISLDVDPYGTCGHASAKAVSGAITVVAAAECKHETTKVVTGKEATCTEAGLTDGIVCSVCDAVIKAQEEIKALGHTEKTVAGKEATCTEAGLTDGIACSVCDAVIKEQEEIKALGHTEKTVTGKAATCTEAGLTDGIVCSVCDAEIKAQEEIKALGHTDVYEADETYHWTVCSVCGETTSEKALHEGEGSCDVCENAFAPIKNGLVEGRFYVNNAVIEKVYALHEYEGKTYYIGDDYLIVKDCVVYVDGAWMAFDANGAKITEGNIIIDSYAFANGVQVTENYQLFVADNGATYFIGDGYKVVKDQAVFVGGEMMYFGANGARISGKTVLDIDGTMYAFVDGVRVTESYSLFVADDGATYFIGDGYNVITDDAVWTKPEGSDEYTYLYFGADGKKATGTIIFNDNVYNEGERVEAYQIVKIGDAYYYVSDGHKIARSTSIYINNPEIAAEARYYEVDADGVIQLL